MVHSLSNSITPAYFIKNRWLFTNIPASHAVLKIQNDRNAQREVEANSLLCTLSVISMNVRDPAADSSLCNFRDHPRQVVKTTDSLIYSVFQKTSSHSVPIMGEIKKPRRGDKQDDCSHCL